MNRTYLKFGFAAGAVALAFFFSPKAVDGAPGGAASAQGDGHVEVVPGERRWWRPGEKRHWHPHMRFEGRSVDIETIGPDLPVDAADHPFFAPIGANGRACVTCHQPSDGMSLSTATIREMWALSGGKDPLFAMVDGANCPNGTPGERESHSLLLERGLIRIGLPWPPKLPEGEALEFSIEVVRDPTGCNPSPEYGLASATPTISVYRRPRPTANLRYILTVPNLFNIKTGVPVMRDPETGERQNMNLLSDARFLTLRMQSRDAAKTHLQRSEPLSEADILELDRFLSGVYMAAVNHHVGGRLDAGGATAGAASVVEGKPLLGDYVERRVFPYFEAWKTPAGGDVTAEQRAFRESVARGEEIFMMRPFYIRDVTHLNTIIGMGNPIKRTCATCHNMQHVGIDGAPGWMDLGTNTLPFAEKTDDLPLFKVTCAPTTRPHPYLGRTILTTDPGRALITGKCVDVGAVNLQQMRGLAERAPYFANGVAADLMEVVDFYDRRFEMELGEQEKQDLVNFMSTL
ncbi:MULTISPECIES: hypothetical protein [unclassified Luteimonas]